MLAGMKWLAVVALAWATPASAAIVLYDGSAGTAPEAQPWLAYQAIGAATATVGNGGVTLDTTAANGTYAGYSNDFPNGTAKNPAFPTLDPAVGFTLSFTARLAAEAHASNDRAGFSVILLGHDRRGVELGFWAGEVWAQSGPAFTHAETNTDFDPANGFHSYDLSIAGGAYALSADGVPLLSGATRDFTSAGQVPYTLGDFLFLGDDTTSARASVQLRQASVTVPEPAAAATVLAVGLAVGRRRRVR